PARESKRRVACALALLPSFYRANLLFARLTTQTSRGDRIAPNEAKERGKATNRSQLFTAGALLLATAAAGVAVNGVSRAHAPLPADHKTSFAAPSTGPVKFTGALD